MRKFIAGASLLLLLAAGGAARADDIVTQVLGCKNDPCVIHNNPGGNIALFDLAAKAIRQGARKRIIVDGSCASACTLLLDRVTKQVCLTQTALLGFHLGTQLRSYMAAPGVEAWVPEKLFELDYSPRIKRWIHSIGGLPRDGSIVVMPPAIARQIWSTCNTPLPRARPERHLHHAQNMTILNFPRGLY